MNYGQAKLAAEAVDKDLRADDPRFRHTVYLVHEEGTSMLWRYAFAVKVEEWYLIFTEHHGTHVYSEQDLSGICQFRDVEIGTMKL